MWGKVILSGQTNSILIFGLRARFYTMFDCNPKKLFFTFLLAATIGIAGAQRIIVNSQGERIVMYPDGSWRLAEARDSTLLRQYVKSSGTNSSEDASTVFSTRAEQEDYLLRQWNELNFHIKSLEKKIQNEFRAATNAQFSAAEIYHNAEANKHLLEPERIATINENYEKSIERLKIAKKNQKEIRKLYDQSKKMAGLSFEKMARMIHPLRSKYNLFVEQYQAQRPSEKVPLIVTEKPTFPFRIQKPKKTETSIREIANSEPDIPAIEPPSLRPRPYKSEPFDCNVTTDSTDGTSGVQKIAIEKGLLFTHTDPDLRPFFKDKELISCYAALSKAGDYVYMVIDFVIASSHSQSNFGSLDKGSLLRLRLLNGEFVSLYNLRADRGRIDPYSGHTIFSGQYAMGKEEIKTLISNELDKVRILWSTGYEDYDVYKIDFFKDRLNCLMQRS